MCGAGAMEVGCRYADLLGCSVSESVLCHDFAQTLVRSAAGVLCSAKPAALFSFSPKLAAEGPEEVRQALRSLVRTYREGLAAYGIDLSLVWVRGSRMMLLVWRPALVEAVLEDPDKRQLFGDAGCAAEDASSLMRSVRQKLAAYFCSTCAEACGGSCRRRASFPHEMGLLFGYPLEDVRGFMLKKTPTCRGPWLAFGDIEESRQRFRRRKAAEGECIGRYRAGLTLAELLG